jgi:hypothetical protein
MKAIGIPWNHILIAMPGNPYEYIQKGILMTLILLGIQGIQKAYNKNNAENAYCKKHFICRLYWD